MDATVIIPVTRLPMVCLKTTALPGASATAIDVTPGASIANLLLENNGNILLESGGVICLN